MKKGIIISGNLAQDHEFIYPYYRLLEEEISVDVCLLEGEPAKGILGTSLPPNKDQTIKKIDELKIDDYDVLILPGGVKAMEKVRQERKIINFISEFNDKKKQRLRVATKYPNLTRDFLFSKGVTQFKLVDSLGATETYPFTGSSEIITDITSTGETLRANNLRVLKDGIILSSSACLLFSKNKKGLNKILNSLK